MVHEKETKMVLKVDLQCARCYRKVKKVLCKFPQIRDQEYNEKNNTVTIKVVCCSPEKMRDKLCSKGRGSIKSIDILDPPKPPKPPPTEPKVPDPKPNPPKPQSPKKPIEPPPPPKLLLLPPPPKPQPHPHIAPPPWCYPPPPPPGMYVCCQECSEGRPGGPCYSYANRPGPCEPYYPPYGAGYYYGGGFQYSYCPTRCNYEHPQACLIM